MSNQQQPHQQQFVQPELFAQQGAPMGMQAPPPAIPQQQQAQLMMNANAMMPQQLLQAGLMMPSGVGVGVANAPQQAIPLLWPNENGNDVQQQAPQAGNLPPGAFPMPTPMAQLSSTTVPTMGIDFDSSSLMQSPGLLSPTPVSESTSVATKVSNGSSTAKKPARGKGKGAAAAKTSKASSNDADENDCGTNKVLQSRERNREHARSTRLRKKAYIQKLKEMAQGLRTMQTAEIQQRRISMQKMLDIQAIRRKVVQSFLQYHATYETDPQKWSLLLEDSFWLKEPVTPFRSFRRSEVDRDSRIVRGTERIMCDAASLALMLERVGCYSARWKRIKRNDYVDEDFLNKEITVRNGPGSSLSSASSTGSSGSTSGKSGKGGGSKRKGAPTKTSNLKNEATRIPKSSSSEASSAKRQKVLPVDNQNLVSGNAFPAAHSIADSSQQQYPFNALSSYNLKLANNKQRTSASYYINEDDMIMIEDVMMCPYMFRTKNAVICGALADCVIPGMLRVQFSPNNKLLNMEMIFDAMGFMQQLDGANGGSITAQVIPGSLEMALMHCAHEARAITEAKAPFKILHVNDKWTELMGCSQLEVEGKSLLPLLEGKDSVNNAAAPVGDDAVDEKAVHILNGAAKGRPGSTTSLHYGKDGKRFVDFMCSYPLTNAQDEITHLLHVSMDLPKGGTYIP